MPKRVLAALCVLASMTLTGARAQEQPSMVRVVTDHVQLGHQQHYESLIPKLWQAFRKAGSTAPVFVSAGVSDPATYIFVAPIASFADIDAQEKIVGRALAAVPELVAELSGIVTSTDQEVWLDRSDLAYVPAAPRLEEAEQGFLRIALLYPYPSQTQAFETVLEERAALRKKHGITEAVGVAQMLIGPDGPAYATLVGAKDEVDFYAQNAKDTQKMGAEWQASLAKGGPMLRRVEFVTTSARPALTYQP